MLKMSYETDLAVLAVSSEANWKLYAEIRNLVRETSIVGDVLSPRKILEAMRESFDIARGI